MVEVYKISGLSYQKTKGRAIRHKQGSLHQNKEKMSNLPLLIGNKMVLFNVKLFSVDKR